MPRNGVHQFALFLTNLFAPHDCEQLSLRDFIAVLQRAFAPVAAFNGADRHGFAPKRECT